nr:MAG TPA: hypothetical protein [Caudoviricetes sp.]
MGKSIKALRYTLFSKFRLSCYTLFITRKCNSCVEVIYYFQFSSLHNLKKSFNYLLNLFFFCENFVGLSW